jgi:hypothetical protein
MTTDLFADLRRLEQYAIAGGADDKLLTRAIPLYALLLMGVRPDAACAFLRARALVAARECNVTEACRRAGLRRQTYYELLRIWGHGLCEPRAKVHRFEVKAPMSRTVKTTPITAPDTLTPPQQANGKPTWQAPQVPRAAGGMAVGETGGNYSAVTPPNSTPTDLLDKEGTGSV